MSRVYGRPDHVAGRTTTKPDQARYQSPGALKPNSKSAAAKRKTTSPPRFTSTLFYPLLLFRLNVDKLFSHEFVARVKYTRKNAQVVTNL